MGRNSLSREAHTTWLSNTSGQPGSLELLDLDLGIPNRSLAPHRRTASLTLCCPTLVLMVHHELFFGAAGFPRLPRLPSTMPLSPRQLWSPLEAAMLTISVLVVKMFLNTWHAKCDLYVIKY